MPLRLQPALSEWANHLVLAFASLGWGRPELAWTIPVRTRCAIDTWFGWPILHDGHARTAPYYGTAPGASTSRVDRTAAAAFPMKREILISAVNRETRVAILEDDQLVELLVDRPDVKRLVGDIFVGRVDAVLPGIQAAFVDIGTGEERVPARLRPRLRRGSVPDDDDEDDEDDGSA